MNAQNNKLIDVTYSDNIRTILKKYISYGQHITDFIKISMLVNGDFIDFVCDYYVGSNNECDEHYKIYKDELITIHKNEFFRLSDKFNNFISNLKTQLFNNMNKGDIFEFSNFPEIITEIEYHKSKLFMAITDSNNGAIKEYTADIVNYYLALGNIFEVWDIEEISNNKKSYELNKGNLIK